MVAREDVGIVSALGLNAWVDRRIYIAEEK